MRTTSSRATLSRLAGTFIQTLPSPPYSMKLYLAAFLFKKIIIIMISIVIYVLIIVLLVLIILK
jgi:molybdopterin biosynthesis enzyme MoaB